MRTCLKFLLTLSFLTMASAATAIPTEQLSAPTTSGPTLSADAALFPRPALLQPRIDFWSRVFSEYSEYQSVIHLQDAPQKIYTVLDFRGDAAERGPAEARRRQRKAEIATKKEVDGYLRHIHMVRDHPEQLSPVERRIYELLADNSDPDRYKDAVGRFRAQRGLREATARAVEVSGSYLPRMEQIFAEAGLPVRLTRLPLVESSFNVEAYSKVGAAGLWQFMPSSARIYMRLDEAVDDRRDPWTSTRAAAAHLKADYAELGSWPLAITAYNHGRGSLQRGLREVKGETLEDLVAGWNGRRFGFASKNFYTEFLAASDVELNHGAHFGTIARSAPLDFEIFETRDYVSYATLQNISDVDEKLFRQLNPGFRPEVLDGRLHVPPQTRIRLPVGRVDAFKNAYAALGDTDRLAQQRFYYVRYKVRGGDNLGSIARRYGVSVSSLKQANSVSNPRALRVGQTLRIPPRGGARTVKISALPEPSVPGTHKVRPGQSLSTIARRYQTSIEALMRLNGLDDAHSLRSGLVLKIPST